MNAEEARPTAEIKNKIRMPTMTTPGQKVDLIAPSSAAKSHQNVLHAGNRQRLNNLGRYAANAKNRPNKVLNSGNRLIPNSVASSHKL